MTPLYSTGSSVKWMQAGQVWTSACTWKWQNPVISSDQVVQGKSVLIELCAGLVSPLSGRAEVLGVEWGSLSAMDQLELRLRIGTVLQQPGLLSNMTV